MHNWHFHARANHSKLLLSLLFFKGFFACDLISPADWHSFNFILFLFFETFKIVGTSRLGV